MDAVTLQKVRAAIDQIGPLPVLDRTVRRVCVLAEIDSADLELISTIERDETFAVNLLRYANSAAVARRIRPTNIRDAVTTIGRRELRRLALEAATYRYLERVPGNGGASRGHLHLHAVSVATCAAEAAERAGADTDLAHLAGLLHDIGKLVLPLVFGEEKLERIATTHRAGAGRVLAEREALGIDHAAVGALVAQLSEVPDAVVAAIAGHHGAGDGVLSPEAACVQVANSAVTLLAGITPDPEVLARALTVLGLNASILDELAESVVPDPTQPDGPLSRRIHELEGAAQTDSLTGVANRGHWFTFVAERLAAGRGGAVFVCDIDFLKQVNDTHGHAAGDEVIVETARVLDRYGFAGRLGGDEFTVWLEGEPARAAVVSNELVVELAARLAKLPRGCPATVSVGVAMTDRHGHELDHLVETADRALYRAKTSGRMRACAAA
jgi:diguanylate cyclase (GGDEF)-like protein/putative nucleotidyltransferase with HDIG domain